MDGLTASDAARRYGSLLSCHLVLLRVVLVNNQGVNDND